WTNHGWDMGMLSYISTESYTLDRWTDRQMDDSGGFLSAPTMTLFLPADWMLPSAPTVTLHILPTCPSPGASDTVTLLCSASGYYPRDLQLTWQAGGKEREGTQVRLLQGKDGRFSSSSNLTMSQAEWDKLGEYSCHVTHPGTGSTQLSTSSKCAAPSALHPDPPIPSHFAPSTPSGSGLVYSSLLPKPLTAPPGIPGSIPLPSLYLLKPSLEDLLTRGEALLTCLAVGYELGQARLTWELDGANWTANATLGEAKTHSNQTQSLLSHLTIPRGVWDSRSSILCRVTHPCSLFQDMEETIWKPRAKAPSVSLVLPSPARPSPNAEVWLTCEVSGFFPSELLIKWKRDNHTIEPSGYITLPPVAEERNSTFSAQSYLKIPVSQWENGAVYTCMVGHESLPSMHYTSRTVLGESRCQKEFPSSGKRW
uniref:Ig-like domain-containing protein n=1 Tax=Terrapene triunguis TaxID=2587831 RepID=A0A674I985_9SAUR